MLIGNSFPLAKMQANPLRTLKSPLRINSYVRLGAAMFFYYFLYENLIKLTNQCYLEICWTFYLFSDTFCSPAQSRETIPLLKPVLILMLLLSGLQFVYVGQLTIGQWETVLALRIPTNPVRLTSHFRFQHQWSMSLQDSNLPQRVGAQDSRNAVMSLYTEVLTGFQIGILCWAQSVNVRTRFIM
jgi:hypothetical protein